VNIADFASCGTPSSTKVGRDNLNPAGVQAATGELDNATAPGTEFLATMHQPVIVQSLHTPAKRRSRLQEGIRRRFGPAVKETARLWAVN
jgi:hypothetical protein